MIKNKFFNAMALAVTLAVFTSGCGGGTSSGSVNTDSTSVGDSSTTIDPSINDPFYNWNDSWLDVYTYSFQGHDVREFPIGAWIAPPGQNYVNNIPKGLINDNNYKNIAESGINAIYGLYEKLTDNRAEIMDAINYAEKYDLVYLLRDPNVAQFADNTTTAKASYKDLIKSPAFGGILVQDEPGTELFDFLTDIKNGMEYVFNGDRNPLFYVNMLPSYASKNQIKFGAGTGGGGSITSAEYANFIDEYISKVNPEVYSYDYYPMEGAFPNVKSNYFSDLAIVREKTMQAEIPFWTFIQSCSWGSSVRHCTQSEIDYQVNMSLAFGAKGVQYFTYWTPYDDAGTSPQFYPSKSAEEIGAMVAPDGSLLPMYHKVKDINKQVDKAGYYLLYSANVGVIQHGNSPASIPSNVKLTNFRQLKNVSGGDSVVGCFEYRGQTLLYVVNNSIQNNSSVMLEFDGDVSGLTIANGTESKFPSADTLSLQLSAGDATLVLLD